MREEIQAYTKNHQLSAAKTLQLLAAHRWLDRLIAHHHRFMNVLVDTNATDEEAAVGVHV